MNQNRLCKAIAAILVGITTIVIGPVQSAVAQLTDGSTAPDFTFTDIQGNSHNLYSYLNQGKYVAIDISATWCQPCWNFHNLKVMDSLYNLHDAAGDNTWKIFFIEADKTTTSADLLGTGINTQGNWVQGSNYTIIDPEAGTALTKFRDDYLINMYPMFYLICPSKQVISANGGAWPMVPEWDTLDSKCFPVNVKNAQAAEKITIYPNPATSEVTLTFPPDWRQAKIRLLNVLGQQLAAETLQLPTGRQYVFPTHFLQAGVYYFSIESGQNAVVKRIIIQ